MPKEILYATGFFDIGDTFQGEDGQPHLVTDILLCHYIRRGSYKVLYEVDHSGEFTELLLMRRDQEKSPTHKPPLQLASKRTKFDADKAREEDPAK